jgi:hypothetical protein
MERHGQGAMAMARAHGNNKQNRHSFHFNKQQSTKEWCRSGMNGHGEGATTIAAFHGNDQPKRHSFRF